MKAFSDLLLLVPRAQRHVSSLLERLEPRSGWRAVSTEAGRTACAARLGSCGDVGCSCQGGGTGATLPAISPGLLLFSSLVLSESSVFRSFFRCQWRWVFCLTEILLLLPKLQVGLGQARKCN